MKKPHDPTFTIDAVVSSKTGVQLTPQTSTIEFLDRLAEDERVFNWSGYQEARAPEQLPSVDLSVLQTEYPRCLDMPVRLAGQEDYLLPDEWVGLAPLLEQLIGVEHTHNPNWREYNTYMTVDCKYVVPDEQQRHGGLHVDGFQGARIDPKNKITRNYVMTTNGGTRFYPQPFIVVDETQFNVFQGFDLQAQDYIIAQENKAYFMDAYTVHESGIADRAGLRTFLRLTYDVKQFDRFGNTHNSMLDYDWEMVARNIHEQVATPTWDDIQNSPHR